jgi:uncharacterized protein YuzE
MSEEMELPFIEFDSEGDTVYVRLREDPVAYSREFGDLRNVDYTRDGEVVGVEFIGFSGGVDLDALPERETLSEILADLSLVVGYGSPESAPSGWRIGDVPTPTRVVIPGGDTWTYSSPSSATLPRKAAASSTP